jgi:hypothetical protein
MKTITLLLLTIALTFNARAQAPTPSSFYDNIPDPFEVPLKIDGMSVSEGSKPEQIIADMALTVTDLTESQKIRLTAVYAESLNKVVKEAQRTLMPALYSTVKRSGERFSDRNPSAKKIARVVQRNTKRIERKSQPFMKVFKRIRQEREEKVLAILNDMQKTQFKEWVELSKAKATIKKMSK